MLFEALCFILCEEFGCSHFNSLLVARIVSSQTCATNNVKLWFPAVVWRLPAVGAPFPAYVFGVPAGVLVLPAIVLGILRFLISFKREDVLY